MAGLIANAAWPTTNINANTVTVMQLVAPTNQRLRILQYVVSFDGTNSANAPALIEIERQTGGTFTNTAVAPKKANEAGGSGETLQAYTKNTQTVAPTSGDNLQRYYLPVFGGTMVFPQQPGQEDIVPGGTIIGVKITTGAAVNCAGSIRYEE